MQADPDSAEVHCLKTTIPSMSGLRKARAFFHDLPSRSLSATGQRVSFVTRENVERSFLVLREGHSLDRTELQHVQTLVNRCPRSDNILEVLDDNGWNILQRVIICNQPQVVSMLISRGCDLNAGLCSLPLHLACKLGHAQIVQLLLDSGAKADLPRRVCYPVTHHLKASAGGKPAKFQCRVALRVPAQPITYAIPSDRHEVLKVLLTHRNSWDVVKKDFLLHEACKFRAKKCLKLLVDMLPDQVNIRDRKGFTPLQHALRSPRNRECAIILLESDAYFDLEIFETEQGTLLHEVYVSDDTSHLLRLTELMLEKGPPDLAYLVTRADGDTLLNKLLKFYGSATPRDRDQYVEEIRRCIVLLIEHGCDPNQVNKKGEGAMHCLLAHHGGRPLFYMRDRFGVAPGYLLPILENMLPLIEELCKRGASANLMSPPTVVTPLFYLMRIVSSMSPQLLCATHTQVTAVTRQLCRFGADPNVINAVGDSAINTLLSTYSRWLYHAPDGTNRNEILLKFTHNMMTVFLSHGLDPQTVLHKNLKQYVIIFNASILDGNYFRKLNQMFRDVIRHGGNTNLINLTELYEGGTGGQYAMFHSTGKYNVSYYLARGLYIHARLHKQAVFEILDVFRNTLCQRHLTKCVEGICSNLSREFEEGPRSIEIQACVREISDNPRSLLQLCRISVCCAINWRIEQYARTLHLPQALRDYIYNLD